MIIEEINEIEKRNQYRKINETKTVTNLLLIYSTKYSAKCKSGSSS